MHKRLHWQGYRQDTRTFRPTPVRTCPVVFSHLSLYVLTRHHGSFLAGYRFALWQFWRVGIVGACVRSRADGLLLTRSGAHSALRVKRLWCSAPFIVFALRLSPVLYTAFPRAGKNTFIFRQHRLKAKYMASTEAEIAQERQQRRQEKKDRKQHSKQSAGDRGRGGARGGGGNRGGGSAKLRGLPKDSHDVRISKTLSWILRHGSQSEGLTMRQDGYVRVDELVRALPASAVLDVLMTMEVAQPPQAARAELRGSARDREERPKGSIQPHSRGRCQVWGRSLVDTCKSRPFHEGKLAISLDAFSL